MKENDEKPIKIVKREKKIDKNKTTKKTLTLALILLLVVPIIIFGASAITTKGKSLLFNLDKNEEEKPEEKKEEEKEEEIKEEPKIKIVNLDSTSRPYAIMINNHSVARPLQSGLQDAYIIYEIIVEGGLTRYMALFIDKSTERIGSIRSARHYFLDYALENDAIYVHHGNSPQALSDFGNLGVDRIEVTENKTGWRAKGLGVAYEHTLFTNIEMLGKGIGSKRTTRNKEYLLKYSEKSIDMSAIANVEPANKVSVRYSNSVTSSYEYDEEAKVYKRFVNGKEHADWETKNQYTFKNIITYKVKNYLLNDSENKGRQGLENVGSGTGYYISEGYAVPIKWSKSSRSAQTVYTYEDGSPLVVNDGNTFIQIQPLNESLSIS